MTQDNRKTGLSKSSVTGIVAIVFLAIGYQTALFIHNAAIVRIAANRDAPDTVYVFQNQIPADSSSVLSGTAGRKKTVDDAHLKRVNSTHAPAAEAVRRNVPPSRVESFVFDPNTVSVGDLCRLGFTVRQAESIDNYRRKGGRFRRKADFAKSYVVSDSIFCRLEPYINIPVVDLNTADSASFDALPGIGGWFASKMISHRKALGGYSYKEQLMDIYGFDRQKFDALSDLIAVSPENVVPFRLWSLPADSLKLHPYIYGIETAKAIVLFRENTPEDQWSIEALAAAGILSRKNADRLSLCVIAE